MSPLGSEEGRHVSVLQARLQACVDQIVGYATIVGENVGGLVGDHFEQHMLTMGDILQDVVDGLGDHFGQPSPATDVEGATWVLRELKSRSDAASRPSTGTNLSSTSGSSSRPASSSRREVPGLRWI